MLWPASFIPTRTSTKETSLPPSIHHLSLAPSRRGLTGQQHLLEDVPDRRVLLLLLVLLALDVRLVVLDDVWALASLKRGEEEGIGR